MEDWKGGMREEGGMEGGKGGRREEGGLEDWRGGRRRGWEAGLHNVVDVPYRVPAP